MICGCVVFVNNLVPDIEIMIAPSGAVKIILKIHIIRTVLPYPISSSVAEFSKLAKFLSATGPRAA